MFGELEFFTDDIRKFAAKANTSCQIAYISKENFMAIISQND